MKIIKDQLHRSIQLKENPERIVSLVPSQTELLVDLGLAERIVGITKFCVHPVSLRKEKKVVGGTKQVHFDRIAALKPDLILCNKEENTEEMVKELEQIAPVHVSDIKTIDDTVQLITQYGNMFNVAEKAGEIAQKILDLRDDFIKGIQQFPERKVAYFIWKNPWMVAGKNTFIQHLLELNRFKNVFLEDASRYPEIELSKLKEKQVDMILLSSEPFPFKIKDKKVLEEKLGIRVYNVDGEFFSWYGSRLIPAFEYFKRLHLTISS